MREETSWWIGERSDANQWRRRRLVFISVKKRRLRNAFSPPLPLTPPVYKKRWEEVYNDHLSAKTPSLKRLNFPSRSLRSKKVTSSFWLFLLEVFGEAPQVLAGFLHLSFSILYFHPYFYFTLIFICILLFRSLFSF